MERIAAVSVYRELLASLWIAWILYWWIASRSAKKDQRRESAASRASHIVPLMIAAWLLAQPAPRVAVLAARVLPATLWAYAAGVAMTAAGLLFSVWARVHLGGNWSATVTVKESHALVRTGPYRFVRHPIYTGLLVALIGAAVARGDVQGFVADAIAFAAFWRKLRIEERWMQETFGDAYARYRVEVAALIPFVL
jgi:protein-S-isoprenylcysteine O-methyltransferase Ste14